MKYTTPLLTLATSASVASAANNNPRAPKPTARALVDRNAEIAARQQVPATVTVTQGLGDIFNGDDVDDSASLRSEAGSAINQATSAIGNAFDDGEVTDDEDDDDINFSGVRSGAGSFISKATSAVGDAFDDDTVTVTPTPTPRPNPNSVVGQGDAQNTPPAPSQTKTDSAAGAMVPRPDGFGLVVTLVAGLVGVGVYML